MIVSKTDSCVHSNLEVIVEVKTRSVGLLMRRLGLMLILCVIVSAFTCMAAVTGVEAAEKGYPEVRVKIDGVLQTFDQPAIAINGRTMVPMRAIFERLGAEIEWENETKTVTAVKGSTVIKITLGQSTAYVNGKPLTLDVAAIAMNGRTLVPLRFVSESLGADVQWDGATSTVLITSNADTRQPRQQVAAPFEFDYLGPVSEGLGTVGVWEGEWKYGYIDDKGKVVIEPQFSAASEFRDGFAAVGVKDGDKIKYGYITRTGSYLIRPQFDLAKPFNNGYAEIANHTGDGYAFGVVDKSGKIIIEPRYMMIEMSDYNIRRGYIIVRSDDRFAVYSLGNGKMTDMKYDFVTVLEHYVELRSSESGKALYGLILPNGKVIEPTYDWIHYYAGVDNVLAMVEKDGKFGLLARDGSYILDLKYDQIRGMDRGTGIVQLNGRYGFLLPNGKMLTAIEFEETSTFVRGVAYVKKDGRWGLLKIDGTWLVEPKYDQVTMLENEIIVVENGVRKILDRGGQARFDADYEYMYPYNSIPGASKVKKNGKEVIIDENGNPVFQVDFDKIWEFEGDVARITLNGKVGYLKRDGSYLVEPIYDSSYKDLTESYYHTKNGELWGLVLEDGTVIPPKYSSPIRFYGDYGIATIDNQYVYMDKNGRELTQTRFDWAEPFRDGVARVGVNLKHRYLKKDGQLLPGAYDAAYDFSDGYGLVYSDGKYRFIDQNGNHAFNQLSFIIAKPFSGGLAPVMGNNGKWGYIDTSGKLVIPHQYDMAFGFAAKIAPVRLSQKYGYIDRTGKWVIEPSFEMVDDFQDGVSNAWRNGKFGYVDENGVYHDSTSGHPGLSFADGAALVKAYQPDSEYYARWGFIKSDGSWLVKPEYDHANPFQNGVGYVYKNGKVGKVTVTGKIEWE